MFCPGDIVTRQKGDVKLGSYSDNKIVTYGSKRTTYNTISQHFIKPPFSDISEHSKNAAIY